MSIVDDSSDGESHSVDLSKDLCGELESVSRQLGLAPAELAERALRDHLERCRSHPGSVFISTPASAMMKGLYEENITIGEIKRRGDFGLGTFNDLDGEMVMLDGTVFQLKDDGETNRVNDSVQTPFSCVTYFTPLVVEDVNEPLDYPSFKNLLYCLIPSMNIFYAVRVEGHFSYVKTWSASRQENYRPITEVSGRAFEYSNVDGTIIGFYTPDFIKSLSMPGYHLHFLTADHRHGGHLHQCMLERGRVSLQFITKVEFNLPVTLDYLTTRLA